MTAASLPRRVRAPNAAAVLGLLAVCAAILVLAKGGRVLHVVPEALLGGLVTVALFAFCGYPLASRLAGGRVNPVLLALPLGCVVSSLALTFLGFLRVPFAANVAVVLVAAAVGWVALRPRTLPGKEVAWPLFLAFLFSALALLPAYRIGALTVLGENPDALLVTGAAEVVKAGPPDAIQPDLPVDRVSVFWQSKYPIYYTLAAVSGLSGLDPIYVMPIVSAALFGMFGLGVFLFCRQALRAPVLVALAAMGLVTADRTVLYLAEHPYYNQLWGMFAFPFMLLFGFRLLREPRRDTAVLFTLFALVGVMAYPLMLPFPLLAIGIAALRRGAWGRARDWLRSRRRPSALKIVLLIPPGLIALALLAAAAQKGISAVEVILPGGNLGPWAGDSPDRPFAWYFGLPAVPVLAALAFAGLLVAAWYGSRRLEAPERVGLLVMCGAALVMGAYFLTRESGEYFAFKTFAFAGPVVLMLAVVGLGTIRHRAAWVALAALGVTAAIGLRDELEFVPAQTPPETVELRAWPARLDASDSIRIDIPPTGIQLWAAYMLHRQPLSAPAPVVGTTYPELRFSRKADYVLVERGQPRPADARGRAVLSNGLYALYAMDPRVPGPDRSSRRRLDPSDRPAAQEEKGVPQRR